MLALGACTGEQPVYAIAADPVDGPCTMISVYGEEHPKREQFEDSHESLIGDSYVLVDGESVFYGPSQGAFDAWYVGEAVTSFPTSDETTCASVEMDYACVAYGPEIARFYWMHHNGQRYVGVSMMGWQDQWYQGWHIETFKQEHFGRLVVVYAYHGEDHYDADVFLYAGHDYLYEEDIGGQTGSDQPWRAAEEAAIHRMLNI